MQKDALVEVADFGVKGGEAEGEAMEVDGFDLSGLADLLPAENSESSESVEADASEESEDTTPVVEEATGDEPADVPSWEVAGQKYTDPSKLAEDYNQLVSEFTKRSQRLSELEKQGQSAAPASDEAPDFSDMGLSKEQVTALENMMSKLGYVKQADLQQQQAQAQEAQQFQQTLDTFITSKDGKDGLPALTGNERLQFIDFLRENPQYLGSDRNLERGYKDMYADQIFEARMQKMAQGLLKKKVSPAKPEVKTTESNKLPPEVPTVDFDDPATLLGAIENL